MSIQQTYQPDRLDGEHDDDGRMQENVNELGEAVTGHRIITVERRDVKGDYYWNSGDALVLTLNNGTQVQLFNTSDCCAYTELEKFLLHPERVDHIITGVATTESWTRWHIFADLGDVLELGVGWSAGNPFYYGYGFDIRVVPVKESK